MTDPNSISRRKFLLGAGAMVVPLALYTLEFEPHWLEIVERSLWIPNLPDDLHGKKLVQLSDLHCGLKVDDEYLIRTFDTVKALDPDIVIVTGDFISHHAEVFDQAKRVYDHFPHGKLGTYGILGNHDYGPGWSSLKIADEITSIMSAKGITILRNDMTEVSGLQVVGLDDFWGPRFGPTEVLKKVDPKRAAIVLSHNPDSLDFAFWENYSGWIFSGHTHGGQCKPPFLPPPLLPVQNKRYVSGEVEVDLKRRVYISRGVGHLIQARFLVRPEVTVFTLV